MMKQVAGGKLQVTAFGIFRHLSPATCACDLQHNFIVA